MKILHIIASADPTGGGPIEGIIRQNAAIAGEGSREIVTLDSPFMDFLRDYPIPVHALGARSSDLPLLSRWRYSPDFVPWLKLNAANYDAIIVNGLWNFSSFGAAQVLPNLGVPYFVFSHGMMDPWFRATYPLKHLAKQIFWLFGEGKLLEGARSVLFTTEEERTLARGQFWGHRYRETVVGYGTEPPPSTVPAQLEAFAAKVSTLKGRPYLLFLSRIHRKKGVDLLIDAFARVADASRDIQLVIAGPDQGGQAAALKARAAELGVEHRLHWPGMLAGDAKWGAFYGCDAFVLPSHQENFGIVVAEAMACGKPVLITDKVNIWREVEGAGAGLVESDTVDGTTRLLQRWFALTPSERSTMSAAAAKGFHDKFDLTVVAPQLLRTLRTMM